MSFYFPYSLFGKEKRTRVAFFFWLGGTKTLKPVSSIPGIILKQSTVIC
jgi:hypothetical protein